MKLTPETRIDDLLAGYPFLLDFLVGRSPKFRLLKSAAARKTVGRVATLAQAASIGGFPVQQLLGEIAAEIRQKTGEALAVGAQAGEGRADAAPAGGQAAEPAAAEVSRERQEVLKDIITDLHRGEDMAALKQRFRELIRDIDPGEIAAMEQALMDEGMPETEVKRLCDVHVEVFKESLARQEALATPPGHPVHTFMLENHAAASVTSELARLLDLICDSSDTRLIDEYRGRLERQLDSLAAIDLHYLRKENQLFPLLEAHDIKGPTQVMWALHDDIRGAIRTAQAELASGRAEDARGALNTIKYAVQSINDMIFKEESILLPMAMDTLTGSDWQRVRQGESEIGYAWIALPPQWPAGASASAPAAQARVTDAAPDAIALSTGNLTPAQIDLILTHLPVELTFLDESDEVRYFSQVKEKLFPRSAGVIGRKVQNCHPPASLDKVQTILDRFRSGELEVASFWLEMKDRFVFIRYFPVRDQSGAYRGTLEVTQDVTGIRALEGEKRLL